MASQPKYSRILLKLGGEALSGRGENGIDSEMVARVSEEIIAVKEHDVQIAVVIGGGNFWRGNDPYAKQIDRATADYMGMLATMINALALQDALEKRGYETRVMSAIEMHQIAEPYIRRRAIHHLNKGYIVIFGAGTGNPFFTTDTAAALRAQEINAQILLKATKVDGVYDKDPHRFADAKKYDRLTYTDALLSEQVRVMDDTAITICKEHGLPIIVFDLDDRRAIERVVMGEMVGTVIGK
ncbi:MAG: UMP kinase [Chloroflexota bacterium]|nr:MAG: UMP kinase [Chloroflexota bacterium]